MHFLKSFYDKNIEQNLINKFIYNNVTELPRLEKIILNFNSKKAELKQLASSLLVFELIANQKGTLTVAKKPNLHLKIRKGNPTGCKLTIKKSKQYNVLGKFLLEIFPNLTDFNGLTFNKKTKKNMFTYEFHDTFVFSELKGHYYYFNNITELNITFVTNTSSKKELIFILKSFYFPLK